MAERLTPLRETLPRVELHGASEMDLHELRVRIPVDLHRQLLSLKVLRGRSLAETVAMALEVYFAERAAQTAGSGTAKA